MRSCTTQAAQKRPTSLAATGLVSIVKDVIREMVANGELQTVSQSTPSKPESPTLAADDLADLGGVMGMFRQRSKAMSNKKFGYARVSTAEQNEDRQVLKLLKYGIEERDIYVDKQSGRSFERTNYMSLRNSILRSGDILVVKSIDRFSRNYSGIRTELEYLTAGAIYLARTVILWQRSGSIRSGTNHIDFTLDEIRPDYDFMDICQGSVPQALEAFFESADFEDAIRNAVSISSDSDTIANTAGAIAGAYYGVDREMKDIALSYLDLGLLDIAEEFERRFILPNSHK